MVAVDALLRSLTLEPVGEGSFRAQNADEGHGVIFGGQLMGQSIVAALAGAGGDGKRVKTLHIVFARAGSPEQPVEITIDPVHSGRAFASTTVTISQGERVCTRAQVLLTADEPDFIRHADVAPELPAPAPAEGDEWQARIVGDVDISDPALVGPPDLDVWTCFPGAPDDDVAIAQALLSYATDAFLIGTSMRPHDGVGQALAHRTISTGVISHTLTFHEPWSPSQWLLLSHHSPYAGHGRSYGYANAFRADGVLAASYVQDAMIRPREASSTL